MNILKLHCFNIFFVKDLLFNCLTTKRGKILLHWVCIRHYTMYLCLYNYPIISPFYFTRQETEHFRILLKSQVTYCEEHIYIQTDKESVSILESAWCLLCWPWASQLTSFHWTCNGSCQMNWSNLNEMINKKLIKTVM